MTPVPGVLYQAHGMAGTSYGVDLKWLLILARHIYTRSMTNTSSIVLVFYVHLIPLQ